MIRRLALARAPEFAIVRWGFPLNAAWEFAQSPLYADWNREWTYLLWTRLHCTVGDVMILLGAFWLTSLVFGTRHWIGAARSASWLFVISGVGYTAWSEWYNVSVRTSWGYAASMPVIAGIGLAPLLQWMLVPPLTLWHLRTCARNDILKGAHMSCCSDVMEPIETSSCCTPKDTAAHAARAMRTSGCGCAPVVEDLKTLKVVGVVTERDVCCGAAADDRKASDVPVADIMRPASACCGGKQPVEQARRILHEHRAMSLPVVDDDGACCGIVSAHRLE